MELTEDYLYYLHEYFSLASLLHPVYIQRENSGPLKPTTLFLGCCLSRSDRREGSFSVLPVLLAEIFSTLQAVIGSHNTTVRNFKVAFVNLNPLKKKINSVLENS